MLKCASFWVSQIIKEAKHHSLILALRKTFDETICRNKVSGV